MLMPIPLSHILLLPLLPNAAATILNRRPTPPPNPAAPPQHADHAAYLEEVSVTACPKLLPALLEVRG